MNLATVKNGIRKQLISPSIPPFQHPNGFSAGNSKSVSLQALQLSLDHVIHKLQIAHFQHRFPRSLLYSSSQNFKRRHLSQFTVWQKWSINIICDLSLEINEALSRVWSILSPEIFYNLISKDFPGSTTNVKAFLVLQINLGTSLPWMKFSSHFKKATKTTRNHLRWKLNADRRPLSSLSHNWLFPSPSINTETTKDSVFIQWQERHLKNSENSRFNVSSNIPFRGLINGDS